MKRLVSIFLILVLLIPNMAMAQALPRAEAELDLNFFGQVLDYIEERYPFETDKNQLIQEGIKGMLESLDPYSNFYTPEEADELYESLSGRFSGIGIYIEEKEGYINIIDTIEGQPGRRAGLKKKDLIISINGESIEGYGLDKSSSMIKGPAGTKVTLGIKRGNEILEIQVVRKTIETKSVDYEILEENIGYIDFREFTSQGTREIKKALRLFDSNKVDRVILDLRDNPGGLLSEAVEVSKLFVPKGPIVHIREKNKALRTYISSLEKPKYELVVLINENSASAAEILAGAIKDRKSGKLVGEKTYGKGTVQSMVSLTNGSVIKLTIAEYLTANEKSINGKGIEPDYKIENTEEDLQLKKAIELLR